MKTPQSSVRTQSFILNFTCYDFIITIKINNLSYNHSILPTDHVVGNAGEDDGGDGPQSDDVRQDLRQEVDRESVVTADVFMSAEREIW